MLDVLLREAFIPFGSEASTYVKLGKTKVLWRASLKRVNRLMAEVAAQSSVDFLLRSLV